MESEKKYNKLIWIISIALPLAVATLFGVNLKDLGFDVQPLSFLPPIYATINGVTAVLLIIALVSIKKGNKKVHELLMKTCLVLSMLFLTLYIAYHMTSNSTHFGGEGIIKSIYFFILITHILLSIAIIPLVLITTVRALTERFDKHRKIAKPTFFLWFYVAVSGVTVYLMISPYYPV